MRKKLSTEALSAIENEVRKVTNQQLENRFHDLEHNLIKNIRQNLNDYLTTNKYKLEEERVKSYRKRMRSGVKLILEKYKEFSEFMKNFESKPKKKKIKDKEMKEIMEQLSLFDIFEGEIDCRNTKEPIVNKFQINAITKEQIEKAQQMKQILDNAFDVYKEKTLKKLKVIPVNSRQKVDYEAIEANDQDTKKMKRKLILLQKVYIEGKTLEEIDYFDDVEYIGSKNYQNDVNSLVDDLMVLIFGYEGLNYIILERLGFELL